MAYSAIAILAILIHGIINVDVFKMRRSAMRGAELEYRRFLFAVLAYHLTDALWGILYARHLVTALFLDTVLYFAAMAFGVLLWIIFVVRYLGKANFFSGFLHFLGHLFFWGQLVALAINFFSPVFFRIDASGEYHAESVRYTALGLQILMFLMCSVYTFIVSAKTEGSERSRHLIVGLFGIVMILTITLQIFYPLLPMYSIGFLLGGCLLHSFVLEDQKQEYMRKLEEALGREAKQEKELDETKLLAFTDALTGVKSKYAYSDAKEKLFSRVESGEVTQFAALVFDLNGLKLVNDTLGHEAGDRFIVNACRLICNTFKHSPVFRIGGDEFAAILQGADYETRAELLEAFERQIEENARRGEVVVAAGMAEYRPGEDKDCQLVFRRADDAMYRRKHALKERFGDVLPVEQPK